MREGPSAGSSWGERALAVALIVVAVLDLATALRGGGPPYLDAGAPGTVLGAGARAAAAGLLARALLVDRSPLRRFAAAALFGLVSLWAPRPVWLYTARHPAFDPFAPMIANLLHVIGIAFLAGAFLRGAAGPRDPAAGFWARQLRGGGLVRLAAIVPVAGYPLQTKLMFGEWAEGGRLALVALGWAWLAVVAACFAGGLAILARRTGAGIRTPIAAAPRPALVRGDRAALGAFAGAALIYLLVRLLAGDLGSWVSHLVADLARPFGPFSLFSVRASAADTAGTVGFSCALLAFTGLLAVRPRARGAVKP